MYLAVLDESMIIQHICEDYKSVVWTERFHGFGDFKLVVPGTLENLRTYQLDYYLYTMGTNKLMIIEQVELNTEYGKESLLTISGRSLESILDRRVMHPYPIWDGTLLCKQERTRGKVKDVIKHYSNLLFKQRDSLDANHARHVKAYGWYAVDELPESIRKGRPVSSMDIGDIQVSAANKVRPMVPDNAVGWGSYPDYDKDPYSMEGSWYKIVQELTDLTMSGWAIEYDGEDPYYWYGYTYNGVNRTFGQGERPAVVFSPKYDNLSKATYFKSKVGTRTKIFSGAVKFEVPYELTRKGEYLDSSANNTMQNESIQVGTNGLGLREGYLQSPSVEQTNGMMHDSLGNKGVQPNDPTRFIARSMSSAIPSCGNTCLSRCSRERPLSSPCISTTRTSSWAISCRSRTSSGSRTSLGLPSTSVHPRTRRGTSSTRRSSPCPIFRSRNRG